jgi:hypothetical protein
MINSPVQTNDLRLWTFSGSGPALPGASGAEALLPELCFCRPKTGQPQCF